MTRMTKGRKGGERGVALSLKGMSDFVRSAE